MTASTRFARLLFFWSGIVGIAGLLPQYFLEDKLGRDFPPLLNHPEYFYGFIGVALAWQLACIVISRDVVRFRLLMLPAAAEKFLFAASTLALYLGGRVAAAATGAACVDLVLGVLFVYSYIRCK
jgi:hypothetical protein